MIYDIDGYLDYHMEIARGYQSWAFGFPIREKPQKNKRETCWGHEIPNVVVVFSKHLVFFFWVRCESTLVDL
jgi:hypothetical protein